MRSGTTPLEKLPARDPDSGDLNVVIETPKGSRNKFKFDPGHHLFKLSGVLPAGASFPFDFGYLPSTIGEDGDPLDVLVLMDEPAFPGCLVPSRLIGVIEAEQTEDGATEKNDRLIGVATDSHHHRNVRSIEDLDSNLMDEIEHFFRSYNAIRSREFKPVGRHGPERAESILNAGQPHPPGKKSGSHRKASRAAKQRGASKQGGE